MFGGSESCANQRKSSHFSALCWQALRATAWLWRTGAGVGPARALALGQGGTRAGPPPPIVPALVAALGPHVRQDAVEYTPGRGGAGWAHARPARRERDRRPGPPPWRAGGGGCARGGGHPGPGTARRALGRAPSAGRSPPAMGPDRRGPRPSGAFRTSPLAPPSAPAPREGLNRPPGGRTGGPPVGSVRGDATGGDQAVDVRLGGQGTGPGGQHTPPPQQTAPIRRVRRTGEARVGHGPEPDRVEGLVRRLVVLATIVRQGSPRPARSGVTQPRTRGGERRDVGGLDVNPTAPRFRSTPAN
jgi:hypothetical protein